MCVVWCGAFRGWGRVQITATGNLIDCGSARFVGWALCRGLKAYLDVKEPGSREHSNPLGAPTVLCYTCADGHALREQRCLQLAYTYSVCVDTPFTHSTCGQRTTARHCMARTVDKPSTEARHAWETGGGVPYINPACVASGAHCCLHRYSAPPRTTPHPPPTFPPAPAPALCSPAAAAATACLPPSDAVRHCLSLSLDYQCTVAPPPPLAIAQTFSSKDCNAALATSLTAALCLGPQLQATRSTRMSMRSSWSPSPRWSA